MSLEARNRWKKETPRCSQLALIAAQQFVLADRRNDVKFVTVIAANGACTTIAAVRKHDHEQRCARV